MTRWSARTTSAACGVGCRYLAAAADGFHYLCRLEELQQHCKQRFLTACHIQPYGDPAEHHGLRLVIAAADHPGAIEERYAVTRQLFYETPVPAPLRRRGGNS